MLPFSTPNIGDVEQRYVAQVLREGMIHCGTWTAKFEACVRELVGCTHFVATTSGTSALHLALHGLGVGPGDEVIVPALTFVATAQAVLAVGARPVPCDVDLQSGNVTIETVQQACTPHTTAVIPVHLRGHPVALAPIRQWAAERDIHVVEDCAQVLGSYTNGSHLGADSRAACFSFGPVKTITCGEGGGLATNDGALYERLHAARDLGMVTHEGKRDVLGLGWRYALSNINAAIGLGQWERLEDTLAHRRALVAHYEAALADCPSIEHLPWDPGNTATYYMVRVLRDRDRLQATLREAGFATGIHYPPLTSFTFLAHERGPLPNTARLADELLTLPLHDHVSLAHVDRIAEIVHAHPAP